MTLRSAINQCITFPAIVYVGPLIEHHNWGYLAVAYIFWPLRGQTKERQLSLQCR